MFKPLTFQVEKVNFQLKLIELAESLAFACSALFFPPATGIIQQIATDA